MIRLRPARATEAKPLVGLYAESGMGKTYSALLLACGFVGGDMSKVAMIETEAGRGEAFADEPGIGGYQVLSLRYRTDEEGKTLEDFSPRRYGEAIVEAERAGVQALIIDSASHEWEGVGGVQAMASANQEAGRKGPLVWQKPKIEHQREFMLRITQSPVPLVILCMRARYPMFEVGPQDVARWEHAGKPGGDKARPRVGEWARAWELEPKQSGDILFEMFVHGWINKAHAFHLTKSTLDAMRSIFIDGERITRETGARLASWAGLRAAQAKAPTFGDAVAAGDAIVAAEVEYINADQKRILEEAAKARGIPYDRLLAKSKVATLLELPQSEFADCLAWIERQGKRTA